jgi:hypothetical protein
LLRHVAIAPFLHNYFLQHRTTKVYRPRKRSSKPLDNDLDAFKHIKQDRDIDRVRQRYMQLTKPELVDLLIRMEVRNKVNRMVFRFCKWYLITFMLDSREYYKNLEKKKR